ncbi:protein plastid transcriptionally active 16, chloroplastic [Selaginella moellendorffii]|nr:protein plastid transcriptionally active 16, chloroplastic [Selaginella moellendorffii]|eukprot:XP_002973541.2 protein plastid transcriptionally active 16, chloroplastic [Selaginella moellendorffii]
MLLEVGSLRSAGNGSYCLATFPGRSAKNRQSRVTIVCARGKAIDGSSSSSGTKRFPLGGTRKKIKDEEGSDGEQESSNGALNFGTQLLNLPSRRDKSSPPVKSGTKKELALSLGLLRRAPDAKTVFVAGATGQIGARVSQQLLRSGFTVRGGVRDLYFAQQLAEFATQYGVISRDEARKINAVEFDFKDVESIAKAIGNAGKVVVTVGPSEDGPRGKVSAKDALQVLEAASVAQVGHVVVVAEAGGASSSGGGPLALITDFFSKLFSKGAEVSTDSLLDSVVDTELRFTFVKVSSTEGVDDFSPDGENVVLLSEGTYNQGTGKVSKSQLASVVAGIFANIAIAENKVVEVATVEPGSSKPIEELLSAIPEDGRRAALAEARAKAEAEERQRQLREQAEAEAKKALEEAKDAAALANELEEEAKELAKQEAQAVANAQKAKDKAKAAAASLEALGAKMKDIGASISETSQNGFGGFFKRGMAGPPAEEEEDVESSGTSQNGFGGFFKRGTVAAKKEEESQEEEEEKPKFGLGNLFTRSKDTASSAETPSPAKKVPSTKTKTPSPPKRRSPPPPPPPAMRTKAPRETSKAQSSAGKKSVLGGLFKQDTIYIDE